MPGYAGYRPTFNGYYNPFGGFRGGGFLGGLVAGGLIGGLMGHGWGGGWGGYGYGGGGGGFLTIIIQLLILFFIVNLVMRIFRRRSAAYSPYEAEPAFGGPQPFGGGLGGRLRRRPGARRAFRAHHRPGLGDPHHAPGPGHASKPCCSEVQDAFGREDYAALRERCTPEIVSYLSEELSENATHGRRNEVTGTHLIQADVGEAWREGDTEYATVAMKYESIDLMRDRTTGAVLIGDPNTPSQTTELWTFARHTGGPWKLSAIQDAK